ncbi:major facilitator superfamily MFS_1 [Pseudoxanthomonas suwonensis 11-1]|uniref:Major facilitator superfamily MFS_1 n=1 Tax=Pseudoxanthomonas suwonensis (strain 11-1) TaxID=743721 RepID=E6WV17_PSEUU|nr:MFS transporter [Pseudoxanthomonas suwonensis]ADV28016.1 major facilitator superfamily MFS_1 [Pseudoxanthomonas suwonensis 11-1]
MSPQRRLPLIIATALFIENMDSTAISTSLPQIAAELGTEPVALKLALTTYMLALAVFIPVSGWVADRYGARRIFVGAIAVFLLGSLFCAASSGLGTLVAGRFVQGVGGAMMVPVGRLVLLRSIEKAELVRALSWLTVPAMLGPILGPVLGGAITTYTHWRFIFLINLPMGLLGMWLAWRFVPDLRQPVAKMDWRGFMLSASGLGLAMFGLSAIGRGLMPGAATSLVIVVGFALVFAYVRHARNHPQPLLCLDLLRIPTYRAGVLGGSLFRIGIGATPFLLPLMLQLGFGLDPLQSGLVTFTSTAGAMFMKVVAPRVLHQFGFRPVLVWNGLLASALLAGFGLFRADTPYWLMVGVLLASGCFRSLQFTSINAIAYADISQERMSQASSLAAVAQQVALALGVTIGGYALSMAGTLTGREDGDPVTFMFAFLTVGVISAISIIEMRKLAPHAGAEMAGRAEAGHEVTEPKVEARPQA